MDSTSSRQRVSRGGLVTPPTAAYDVLRSVTFVYAAATLWREVVLISRSHGRGGEAAPSLDALASMSGMSSGTAPSHRSGAAATLYENGQFVDCMGRIDFAMVFERLKLQHQTATAGSTTFSLDIPTQPGLYLAVPGALSSHQDSSGPDAGLQSFAPTVH